MKHFNLLMLFCMGMISVSFVSPETFSQEEASMLSSGHRLRVESVKDVQVTPIESTGHLVVTTTYEVSCPASGMEECTPGTYTHRTVG